MNSVMSKALRYYKLISDRMEAYEERVMSSNHILQGGFEY